jgi:hypothetical protein
VTIDLKDGPPTSPPLFLASDSLPVGISTPVTESSTSTSLTTGIAWVLTQNLTLDIDVQSNASNDGGGFEWVAETITSAQRKALGSTSKIVITNVLPPQSSIDLPIVKLLSHPGYIAYSSHVASLSLVPNTLLKFVPPRWYVVSITLGLCPRLEAP